MPNNLTFSHFLHSLIITFVHYSFQCRNKRLSYEGLTMHLLSVFLVAPKNQPRCLIFVMMHTQKKHLHL